MNSTSQVNKLKNRIHLICKKITSILNRHKIEKIEENKKKGLTISVITPSFNQAKFLPLCIESIARQTVQPIDHIILDPGSTDGSIDIALEYSKKYPYIQLINEPDNGQADAINKGFTVAKGDILVWLNSDDMFDNDKVFENVINTFIINGSQADVVYGKSIFVDEYDKFLRNGYVNSNSNLLESFHYQVGIIQPSVFIRNSVFKTVGGPPTDMEFTIDYEYWVRITRSGFKWFYIDKLLSNHRWWPDMKTASRRDESLYEHLKTTKKHFGYVHYKWAERLAECEVGDIDGIVNTNKSGDRKAVAERIKEILSNYNLDINSLQVLNQNINPIIETKKYMMRLGIDLPSHYFQFNNLEKLDHKSHINEEKLPISWKNLFLSNDNKDYIGYQIDNDGGFFFEKKWLENELLQAKDKILHIRNGKGRNICVIVGNGPSLNKINFNLLKQADVILSNFGFYNKELQSLATYFTVTNRLVAEQGSYEINSIKNIIKFFPYWLAPFLYGENTYYLNANVRKKFSKDITTDISWRSTVSFFNMQLAYALGYRTVILVGFDHNYNQDVSLKEGDVIEQIDDDDNHFDPRYFKGKKWQAADVNNMEEMYLLAKKSFEDDGREIINATVGGKLEVFKRGNLDEILKPYDKK